MKILYHHRTLGDGAEGIHVAEIIKALRKLGHEVRVVSLIGETTNLDSSAKRRWSWIKRFMPGVLFELGELVYNLPGYIKLSRAVKEFRPDLIYDRYISYNYSAVAVGRRYGVPVFLEVNSPYSFQKQTFDERLYLVRLSRFFEKKICRDATRVIVVSTPLKKYLGSIGVPEEDIVVMPNGVDPDWFQPQMKGLDVRKAMGLEDRLIIGFTGILRPWHGLDMLIEAFERVSSENENLHLLIVGDGPIRSELERIVENKKLSDRVTVTGRLRHDLVRSYLAAMDIAVSPLATFYASPMKILEYMGMGKAILAPDMENIRDILNHRENAVLFRPEDSADLADGLRLLLKDPALRLRIGAEARRKVQNERTWLGNAKAVIELAENVC